MGFDVVAKLKRPGFYPAGGGVIDVEIGAPRPFEPLVLEHRGALVSRMGEAVIANLWPTIAERELAAVGGLLGWSAQELFICSKTDVAGPGNCLLLTLDYECVCEVVSAFGRIGASSEMVATEAVSKARAYLTCNAPIGSHLADQLILPMTLAAGGRFITSAPSLHTRTNIEVVRQFLLDIPVAVASGYLAAECWLVTVCAT